MPDARATGPAPLVFLLIAIILLATVDDRHVGRANDERQMIWTAVALTETGQMGQARGRDFNYIRSDGEAVSRFGLGMTVLELPAATLAPYVERVLGPGSSQPLFLLAPIAAVLLAGGFAARAAKGLGGDARAATIALILCVLGSPLGAYAQTALSESLQAAAIAAAYALSLASVRTNDRRRSSTQAFLSGIAMSAAVLAKSSLIVVAPAALLPLATGSEMNARIRRFRNALGGFVSAGTVWAYFEFRRFGGLLAGYPGEQFNHAFWDGLWRLTIGPNIGFVFFCPAVVIALGVWARTTIRRDRDRALCMTGAVLPFVILLCLAARWWAWHGVWGWGPRLLVPAVPLLAACAAVTIGKWPRSITYGFVVLSVAINVPGLLQHPFPITNYETNLAWPEAPDGVARSLPGYAWRMEADGTYRISPVDVLARIPRASQFLVFPWFRRATSGDAAATARALATPPWRDVRPDLVPSEMPVTERFVRLIVGPPRARFWGRGFFPSREDAEYAAVYDEGLADQVIRLQQQHNGGASLRLAEKLVEVAPRSCHDALVLESYRILGDRQGARAYLDSLPRERRVCGRINVVLALFQRDAGDEAGAKQLLESVAALFPSDAPIQRALTADLSAWPADLQSMIASPVKAAGE